MTYLTYMINMVQRTITSIVKSNWEIIPQQARDDIILRRKIKIDKEKRFESFIDTTWPRNEKLQYSNICRSRKIKLSLEHEKLTVKKRLQSESSYSS